MTYVGTIKFGQDTSSRSFKTDKEARTWLDSENNNLEHTTIITVYDDEWKEISSYVYTEGER